MQENTKANTRPDIKSNEYEIYLKKDFDKHYLLKKFLEIPDAPEKIYTKGSFGGEHLHTVAIVGSRDMTSYGKDVLERIISGLAGHSVCIISGLALGVDAEAHRNAIKYGVHTIAIPGSGLSHKAIYPKTNYNIAEKILNAGGLLLSELEPVTGSAPWTFPRRNRLMAALADVVVIVEADFKSGTMITARLALEYNKDVLAVPGSIFSKTSNGTNRLISQGAKLVTCSEDILEALGIKVEREDEMLNAHDGGTEMSAWKKTYFDKKSESNLESKINLSLENLSDTEKEILAMIKEPISKDKLISISERDVSEVLMTITLLEMRNFVKEEGGVVRRVR